MGNASGLSSHETPRLGLTHLLSPSQQLPLALESKDMSVEVKDLAQTRGMREGQTHHRSPALLLNQGPVQNEQLSSLLKHGLRI